MERSAILGACDHTLLQPTATWEEIRAVCDEAAQFDCASVCIPPSYVSRAVAYLNGAVPVCTVIGFPNGYATTACKCFEAREAIENGASEIDAVVNLGDVRGGRFDAVADELAALRRATAGHVLKVIIETGLLTREEKLRLCQIVTDAGADFIKTSTGFFGGGATREDVALLRAHVGPAVRVKASGGIRGLADAEAFLALGASRLGTSRVVRAAKEAMKEGD